jgi:hypothetical protein
MRNYISNVGRCIGMSHRDGVVDHQNVVAKTSCSCNMRNYISNVGRCVGMSHKDGVNKEDGPVILGPVSPGCAVLKEEFSKASCSFNMRKLHLECREARRRCFSISGNTGDA